MKQPVDRVALNLLLQLAKGDAVSGSELGTALNISRAAVWKRVNQLRDLGVEIQALRGKGYCLAAPVDLIDQKALREHIDPASQSHISSCQVDMAIDSTNAAVGRLPLEQQHGALWLAEYQWAGRGRRGRSWYSPLGANIYLSLGWRFDLAASALGCLSLATGVAVRNTLTRLGASEVMLKWPNDVRVQGKKIAGCLVEIRGDANGPCNAVIGVGLNVAMSPAAPIDQAWCSVRELNIPTSKTKIAALLADELIRVMLKYQENGFKPFANDWAAADELSGNTINLVLGEQSIGGVARGVAVSGALLVETGGVIKEFHAGDASVQKT